MVKCFAQLVILSSVFSLLIVPQVPAAAEVGNEASSEEEASIGGHGSLEQLETPRTNDPEPMTRNSVLDLNEMEQPATTVAEWFAQMETALVQITGVRIETTETGLQVVLQTAEGELSAPATETVGNALIADIPNAVLALPEGKEFQSANPAEGIALVSVTGLPNNRVRVAITGVDAPPTAEVRTEVQGLVFGVTPGTETDAAQDEEAIQVVVTGEQEEGYVVDNATTATRTDTPIRDVPQSIQVVPQQVLEDQRPNSLSDALRNVSGISSGNSSLQNFESPIIRGFDATTSIFTNGTRNTVGGFSLSFETANVERIEVLKGPASVLYGQAEPGGIINLVTELPLVEPYYAIEGTVGNYDFYSPSIDISGPLNEDRTIRYRLNALYQNSGTFIDFVDTERLFIAPVLSFQLGENTNLIVEGSYQRRSQPSIPGLPAVGTVLPNPLGEVDRSRFLGDPDFAGVEYEATIVGYRLEHEFNDSWSIRNAFRAEFGNLIDNEVVFQTGLEADNRTVTRAASSTTGNRQGYSLQTDVIGEVQTGSIGHDLLFGVELRRFNNEFEQFFGSVPSIDLFDPEYGLSSVDIPQSDGGDAQDSFVGVYAQDLITITDNLKILIGGRFDWAEQRYEDTFLDTAPTFQGDTAFSPRAGIVYQPIEPVSLYASFSRSFNPEGGFGFRNTDGTPFEPTIGEQFEVGVKTDFLDGRLSATLAAYQLTRQNDVVDDPDRPGFFIQVGERRSRGVELDVIGEILPGWNLIASYAYTDAEIIEDTSGFEGNRPNNVPRHSGSLWTTYEIQSGDFQGLGFGAGIFVVGDRPGDLANTFELPSYVRTDATIFYRRDNWQAQLNFQNLFDVDYFESANSINRVVPAPPFTIKGTVSVRF
jgi:iron complex outermembrane recepter protein